MTIEERLEAIENTLLRIGISPYTSEGVSASFYPSKYSGEEIDALLDKVAAMVDGGGA